MKYHVYYFSSTGNTAHALELITERLISAGHEVKTIRLNRETLPLEEKPDRLLIAFPTFSWVPPILIQRFVRKLPSGLREDGTKIKTAVFTCDGGGCLQAPAQLKRMLTRRNYDVFLTGRASFPDNWAQFVPGPNEEQKRNAISKGDKMALEFAGQLIGETVFYYNVALIHQIWSRLIGIFFAFLGRQFMGKMFIADKSCTSCKLCRKSCPVGAITMRNTSKSRPFWTTSCESCNRCINICPEKAIVSSNMRIVFFIAGITAAVITGLHLYNKFAQPWIMTNIPSPFYWFVNTIIVTLVAFAAHWFVIGPVDRFVLRFIQRIPGMNRLFENGFNKNFLKYTMPGFKPPIENMNG